MILESFVAAHNTRLIVIKWCYRKWSFFSKSSMTIWEQLEPCKFFCSLFSENIYRWCSFLFQLVYRNISFFRVNIRNIFCQVWLLMSIGIRVVVTKLFPSSIILLISCSLQLRFSNCPAHFAMIFLSVLVVQLNMHLQLKY